MHKMLWLNVLSDIFRSSIWPWLSRLQGWVGLTMAFCGKFGHMAHHFILLQLKPSASLRLRVIAV